MDDERRVCLKAVEHNLQYSFLNLDLLNQSLTHRSFTHEGAHRHLPHNERLEFLGDAVLNLIVSDLLMTTFPAATEGVLSQKRSACVNERTLAHLAQILHLGESLLLGRGEEGSGGRKKPSLLADALEAVIGAIYLDGGFAESVSFATRWFKPLIAGEADDLLAPDYKSQVQEWCQAKFKCVPRYRTIKEEGPDHDKTYVVTLEIPDCPLAQGTGKSRKEAEKEAAKRAYELLIKGG